MAANQSCGRLVKRAAEDNENEVTVKKNLKFEDTNGVEYSLSGSSSGTVSTCSSCTSSSQNSSNQFSQGGINSQIESTGVPCQIISPKKNSLELKLTKGTVLRDMLTAFSKDDLPESITFNGDKYNLTPAFEEFWQSLYNSPEYTYGHAVKLIIHKNENKMLLPIAKVLRRGWEDQKYFPEKLAYPFLEACLFNREYAEDILFTSQTFKDFINPSEGELIEKYEKVNYECLEKVFNKYIKKKNIITVGMEVETACIKALQYIMFEDTKLVRDVWTHELVGLIEFLEFKFLLNKEPIKQQKKELDMYDKAPHWFWKTFFYEWDKPKVDFYFDLISEWCSINIKCQYCPKTLKGAKELVSPCCCDMKLHTLHKDRHDSVLKIIVQELKKAIEKQSCYFFSGKPWTLLVSYGNFFVKNHWPGEIGFLNNLTKDLYPHVVVYSTSPKKRALVIEITISWEHWVFGNTKNPYDKVEKYEKFADLFRQNGFETELHNIQIGARGAFCPDLYKLFEEVFGMKHGNISRVLESISRKIIDITYSSFYCPSKEITFQ